MSELITLSIWSGYVGFFVVLFVLKNLRKEITVWQKDVPMVTDSFEKEKTADGKGALWQVIKKMAARYIVQSLLKSRASSCPSFIS